MRDSVRYCSAVAILRARNIVTVELFTWPYRIKKSLKSRERFALLGIMKPMWLPLDGLSFVVFFVCQERKVFLSVERSRTDTLFFSFVPLIL